ncbi:molybdate ABC transporter substrate-binding protein [Reichenbachiella sp.]|uniref:molybdate ABC transporter substrate-binding protein n=1 Tax=Reichenbachiella sp. TaxID=2184521 RepID=UPI003B58CE7B
MQKSNKADFECQKISLLFLLLGTFSCISTNESKVTIAVAANMQHTMQSLIAEFESSHDIRVETSSSSSGILTTQIKQGAPFDIFLSADMNHPSMLHKEGFASAPAVYAEGKLIFWTMNKELILDSGIDILIHPEIKKIAIANAETAPYGFATAEALKSSGLFHQLKSKLIIGESISQVNQYVQTKNVDIGLTSQSVLYSPHLSVHSNWKALSDTLYSPIRQGIVLLNHGKENNLSNSEEFYNFMFSNRAKEILLNYGYQVSK